MLFDTRGGTGLRRSMGGFGPCVRASEEKGSAVERRQAWPRTLTWLGMLCILTPGGCSDPRRLVSYPPESLAVLFEPATTYSTCLIASVAMAANYLDNDRRLTVPAIMADLKEEGASESRVGDVQAYLESRGLRLLALSGHWGDEPEAGLGFWLKAKGYPVICIINRIGADPAFNHAVVVIGMQSRVDSSEMIHYLDPSADRPLYSCDRAAFEAIWARSGRAMLVVVRPPVPEAVGPGRD